MKKFLQTGILGLAMALGLSACQKDFDNNPDYDLNNDQNLFRGSFSALIDGNPFEAEIKSVKDTTIEGVRSLSITGIKYHENRKQNSYQSINISIPNYVPNANGQPVELTPPYNCLITYTNAYLGDVYTYTSWSYNADYNVSIENPEKGNFSAQALNTAATEQVIITDGKFDLMK